MISQFPPILGDTVCPPHCFSQRVRQGTCPQPSSKAPSKEMMVGHRATLFYYVSVSSVNFNMADHVVCSLLFADWLGACLSEEGYFVLHVWNTAIVLPLIYMMMGSVVRASHLEIPSIVPNYNVQVDVCIYIGDGVLYVRDTAIFYYVYN